MYGNATSITVNVLANRAHGDCTNGGVTSRHDRLELYASRAAYEADEDRNPALSLIVVHRTICGRPYVHAEPALAAKGLGGMAGGNFVYTCDSRYSEVTGVQYPISVHDRVETPEQYAELSR